MADFKRIYAPVVPLLFEKESTLMELFMGCIPYHQSSGPGFWMKREEKKKC